MPEKSTASIKQKIESRADSQAIKKVASQKHPTMRSVFHKGRLSMEIEGKMVGKPGLRESRRKRSSDSTWSGKRALISVMVKENLLEGPGNQYTLATLKHFRKRQLKYFSEILVERTVKLPALNSTALFFYGIEKKSSKRSHNVLLLADPYTMVMIIVLERAPMTADEVLGMVRTMKIERRERLKADSPKPAGADVIPPAPPSSPGKRLAPSTEDLANMPRSQKSGAPSVANSCYLPGTMECYETAYSSVGRGCYSSRKQCLGTFTNGPCPAKDRMGFCRLNPSQLISFYAFKNLTTANVKRQCESTYRGTWLGLPKKRPWPRNK
ncbi:MAG: hypothetical protein KKC99_00555 [Proteobacteria bacterium]|nr:hypothetical protein [Pseudomonadota bacterium]